MYFSLRKETIFNTKHGKYDKNPPPDSKLSKKNSEILFDFRFNNLKVCLLLGLQLTRKYLG